jgi:hypothetical protein
MTDTEILILQALKILLRVQPSHKAQDLADYIELCIEAAERLKRGPIIGDP